MHFCNDCVVENSQTRSSLHFLFNFLKLPWNLSAIACSFYIFSLAEWLLSSLTWILLHGNILSGVFFKLHLSSPWHSTKWKTRRVEIHAQLQPRGYIRPDPSPGRPTAVQDIGGAMSSHIDSIIILTLLYVFVPLPPPLNYKIRSVVKFDLTSTLISGHTCVLIALIIFGVILNKYQRENTPMPKRL